MKQIPFLDIKAQHSEIRSELESAFQSVMDSGHFIMGNELEMFETEFAQYCNVKYCIGVGNGLEALHLLLQAYGIKSGDEVIVPSNTFIATWLAVSECGATPVPVEPCIDTYNIDPQKIKAAITSRTRAIIPVHLYGQPADMDAINQVAKEFNLIVIEDAAQAQGAEYKKRKVGSLADSAATSFYPGKNLGCLGDGGAILTNDDNVADKVKKLRNYGSSIKYSHEVKGYNSRLDELQAALLRKKLKKLTQWNEQRRNIAKLYQEKLSHTNIHRPFVPDWADPVWHLYVIRTKNRNELQQYLSQAGIATVIHYPVPPHLQSSYKEYSAYSLPIAENMANEILSIPIYPHLSVDDVEYVAHNISQHIC